MNDLEMTKLCAEAMGVDLGYIGIWPTNYDPLHDDAHAMALVKKFGLSLRQTDHDCWDVWKPMGISGSGDNLNRAIVECVAKMQKVKVVA